MVDLARVPNVASLPKQVMEQLQKMQNRHGTTAEQSIPVQKMLRGELCELPEQYDCSHNAIRAVVRLELGAHSHDTAAFALGPC